MTKIVTQNNIEIDMDSLTNADIAKLIKECKAEFNRRGLVNQFALPASDADIIRFLWDDGKHE